MNSLAWTPFLLPWRTLLHHMVCPKQCLLIGLFTSHDDAASWVWLSKISPWSQFFPDTSKQIWIWFWVGGLSCRFESEHIWRDWIHRIDGMFDSECAHWVTSSYMCALCLCVVQVWEGRSDVRDLYTGGVTDAAFHHWHQWAEVTRSSSNQWRSPTTRWWPCSL